MLLTHCHCPHVCLLLQPPKAYSKQAQSCKLAVLLSDKAYVSRDSYPCSLLEWSKERTIALGRGCCTNAAV